jgi:sporulation protein YlmC with PRC-barrel domain
MKTILALLGVISLLSFGLAVNSTAAEPMAPTGGLPSEVTDLVGSQVQTFDGHVVGSIADFIFDTGGRAVFAILYQGDRENFDVSRHVAVPFGLLSFRKMGPGHWTVTVNADKGALFAAPRYEKNAEMNWSDWGKDVYRYYGQQPYWTMEESEK